MGSLTEIFVPKVLGECYQACSTGILDLNHASIRKTIHFRNGAIVFATSNLNDEDLGVRLVKWGVIAEESLQHALKLMDQYSLRFKQALIQLNCIKAEELPQWVTRQIGEIVYSTFDWFSPDIAFEHCELPKYEYQVSLAVGQVLLEGLRRMSDTELIKRMIGDLQTPLLLDIDPRSLYQTINFQPEEAFVVTSLEDCSYTTKELLELGTVSEAVVLRTISALRQLGAINIIKPMAIPLLSTLPPVPVEKSGLDTREVMEFCYLIETKMRAINSGTSHYQLLEVNHHATLADIEAAYQRLAKQFHPCRQADLDEYSLNLSMELEIIFNAITQAHQVLTDPKTQQSYEQEMSRLFKRSMPASSSPAQPAANSLSLQQTVMEFCHQIERKLAEIRDGATHYQVLELERDASKDVIAMAGSKLTKQFDLAREQELSSFGLNVRDQLREIALAITKANEVLSDPVQKQRYDEQLIQMLRRSSTSFKAVPDKTAPEIVKPTLPTTASTNNTLGNMPKVTPLVARPAPVQADLPKATATPVNKDRLPIANPSAGSTAEKNTANNAQSIPRGTKEPGGKTRALTAAEYYIQGIEYHDRGKYQEAITVLKSAIEISPKDAVYWAQLGRSYAKLANSQKLAEEAIKEAVRLDPEEVDYLMELGLFYKKNGATKKAAEILQQALQLDPQNINIQLALQDLPDIEKKGESRSIWSRLGLKRD
ncbi:MAG: DnaJ domain-containing protein [Acidobacteriota bacterium]